MNDELKTKSKKLTSYKQGLRDYQDGLVPLQETVTKVDEVLVNQMAVGMDKEEARKHLVTVQVYNKELKFSSVQFSSVQFSLV